MNSFKQIADEYRKWRDIPDPLVFDCTKAQTLDKAIIMAATAREESGRKHKHQWRIPNHVLENFADVLLEKRQLIARANSFEELMKIVEDSRPKGIGILTIYDTAQRISAKRSLQINYIYLHSGTRIGAEIVMRKKKLGAILKIDELPEEVQREALSATELEDLFCHFKKELKNVIWEN